MTHDPCRGGNYGKILHILWKTSEKIYITDITIEEKGTFMSSTVYSKRNAHKIPNFFVALQGEGDQKFTRWIKN